MKLIKNYKLLMFGIITFIFSLTISVSVYAKKNTADYMLPSCYFCNAGTCDIASGTGWTACIDASPGGTVCALGGSDCGKGSVE